MGLATACLFVAPTSPDTAAPATPLRWVNAYEAAAIDNPRLVCSQLFAPPLAKAFARVAHGRCASYFSRIRSSSLKILGITEQGQTAVVSLHQTIENTDWAVVLQRHGTSWWAIDLVTGRALR